MTRTLFPVVALASLLLVALPAPSALALDEAERLWLVGEQASADGLHPVARRVLERFVAEYPNDARVPSALLLLGRARLALGDSEQALDAFRRFRTVATPAQRLEGRFWEAEALYRVKRFAEARTAYDEVMRQNAASPLAADAAYGLALCELELRRPEAAAKAFREVITTWPEHPQASSATFYLAQTLFDLKRYSDAQPLLTGFAAKYPKSRFVPDAQYLLGSTRLAGGEREAGVEDLKAFVAAYPSHPQAAAARQAITATLAKHGNKTQQQSAYTQLMQQSPPTPEALYDAGLIAGRLGQAQNQDAAWRRLRKEFPNHALARPPSSWPVRRSRRRAGRTPRPRPRRPAQATTTRSAPRRFC
jgi:TolA-binding protein